jgi:CRISPR system Cascade subunit CasC
MYGGVRRARVSSQSWKHAMRMMFRERLDALALGQRTKDIAGFVLAQMPEDIQTDKEELKNKICEVVNLASAAAANPIIPDAPYAAIKKAIKNAVKAWKNLDNSESEPQLVEELQDALKGFDLAIHEAQKADEILKVIDNAIASVSGGKDSEQRMAFERKIQNALLSSPIVDSLTNASSDALFFMGRQEALNIAKLTADYIRTGQKPSKDSVQEALNYFPKGNGLSCFAVDVALFGRMVAKAPELNVDASAQLAHAISTHRVEKEFDYFTAKDDLAPASRPGAGMIGDVEFNSSTLYRYATLAIHELYEQLARDADATAKAAAEFVRAFAFSMPDGRRNSFANYTVPDAIYAAIRDDRPVNLVGAFENPVQAENGYASASMKRLGEYAQNVCERFVPKPRKAYVIAFDSALEALGEASEAAALPEAVAADVREALR